MQISEWRLQIALPHHLLADRAVADRQAPILKCPADDLGHRSHRKAQSHAEGCIELSDRKRPVASIAIATNLLRSLQPLFARQGTDLDSAQRRKR